MPSPARVKGNIHHTGLDAPANAQRNVSSAQLKAFVYNQPRFVTDDALFHFQFYIFQRLIVEHIDHLLGAAQAGGVGVFCGNADGLMGGFDNDLGGLGQCGNGAAQGDDAEGLGLVCGETAHPLMQYGGDCDVVIAVLL